MDEATEWIADSNEAVEITLENGDEVVSFKPKFTYPIFGDEEAIVGYKGLRIKMRFDASTLLPLVEMTYDEKLSDDIQDPLDRLKEFLEWETSEEEWNKKRSEPVLENTTSVSATTVKGETFDIVKTRVVDSKEFHLRMRVLVLFFIEAGSYIDESDERWDVYLLFSKNKSFAGFTTVYPYFWYRDAQLHDSSLESLDAIRKRISQFVILPAFQERGLGSMLYEHLMEEFLADNNVKEVTVEDPSEAFDDLRDRCDLHRLAKQGVWNNVTLPVSREWFQQVKAQQKMAPRQLDRCIEMAALHNSASKFGNKKYRLSVKRRLYVRNQEALEDLDKATRYGKLQETYDRLIEDYRRIMGKVDFASDSKGKGKRLIEDA